MSLPTFDSRAPMASIHPERDWVEIMGLWLTEWFDGDPHTVEAADAPTVDLLFPLVTLSFGTEVLKEAGSGAPVPDIHSVLTANDPRRRQSRGRELEYEAVSRDLAWTHFVRVAHQGRGEKRANNTCRQVADLLRLLLEHTPRVALAKKGLTRLKITAGPTEMPMAGYQVRMLRVTARATLDMERPTA